MNWIKKQFYGADKKSVHAVYEQKNGLVLFTFNWSVKINPIYGSRLEYNNYSKTLVWSENSDEFKEFEDLCTNNTTNQHGCYQLNDVNQIDGLCNVSDEYVSFKEGNLYLHADTDTCGNLYGEPKPMLIQVPSNAGKGKIIVLDALELETTNNLYDSNNPQNCWEVSEVTTPPSSVSVNGQKSYINAAFFKQKEGLYVTSFNRDVNTLMAGAELVKLYNGNVLRGKTALITLQNYNPNPVELYLVTIKESSSELS